MDLKDLRLNYSKNKINFNNLEKDPINYFKKWFGEISKKSNLEVNACVLSTVSSDNKTSSRVVLLKIVNENGFTFFTNFNSMKSRDIKENSNVSLNFYWPELERQVRINGVAKRIKRSESINYFNSRPRNSKLGAWISDQSSEININHDFEKQLESIIEKFNNKEVSCPPHWGGYCINPLDIEFWQGRPSRLHDRLLYEFKDKSWISKRLSP